MVDRATSALNNTDWGGAEVEYPPPSSPMVVHSVRLPVDVDEWLLSEADRQGVTPSQVLRRLVEQAARRQPTDTTDLVTVRRTVLEQGLRHALNRAIQQQPTQPAA